MVSRVLVTLILKQRITKKITFPVLFNDVPRENPVTQSTPTGSASSKGKAEPTDVGRRSSKSSQLSEEQTRSKHHDLETKGSTSTEPADTKDGSSHTDVFTRPRPLPPSSKESPPCELAYQVTHDYHVTEPGAIAPTSSTEPVHSLDSAAEEAMGVLAPQASAANVVQELVPGPLADRNMHQRPGNVYINVNNIKVINNSQVNNPHGNTAAPAPVPIACIVPPRLQHELRCRLNRESPVFDDWRGLANQLELQDYIQHLEQCKNPTEELLVLAESQKKIQNLGDLAKAFERMNRGDCQELCENYAFKRTKTDDDTDTSD
ncbi:uncharacterized protein LOC105441969 [Strongylocentrotus purpuratus]|uniref:Death domain-containing protein n=1 Tax=Strongylocentrotus purpuratus TaxID=7668 RepID=A0A7M7NW70_STRPU|nr:uncharacterized protein LOC105441969 [Strongylocentrotus purpuratus]